jgi:tetratricopeptide (TPR) repeat protein
MSADWKTDWDFGHPEATAAKFERRLSGATPGLTVVLQTQIARTWGLRGDFDRARSVLKAWESKRDEAGPEARARWWLEWGRTLVSTAHGPDQISDQDREVARHAYEQAWEASRAGGLDDLAADALHMVAVVETDPARQVAANQRALEFVLGSDQADARDWEPSLRNNLGMSLQAQGDLDGALREFDAALALRRVKGGQPARIAAWMVAWVYRLQGRLAEALAAQTALEAECTAAQDPDPYVLEELETLHRALGNEAEAQRYAGLRA